jgi:hypothetical protein
MDGASVHGRRDEGPGTVLGPPVMQALRNDIRNCPEPYEHSEAGHFVQEWGEEIARKALAAFDG